MINIRAAYLGDKASINTVHTLAFGQKNEAKLVEAISLTEHYIPELSLVAEVDGAVVGHILFSYIDLVGETTLQVLGLAPLAVLPEFQRRGIGSALVNAGLEIADRRGEAVVILLGHPQFYTRFGFVPSVTYGIQPPFEVPEDVFMVKPL